MQSSATVASIYLKFVVCICLKIAALHIKVFSPSKGVLLSLKIVTLTFDRKNLKYSSVYSDCNCQKVDTCALRKIVPMRYRSVFKKKIKRQYIQVNLNQYCMYSENRTLKIGKSRAIKILVLNEYSLVSYRCDTLNGSWISVFQRGGGWSGILKYCFAIHNL